MANESDSVGGRECGSVAMVDMGIDGVFCRAVVFAGTVAQPGAGLKEAKAAVERMAQS